MDHTARMRVPECERDVAELGDRFSERRAALGLDPLRERLAVHVSHDEEHLTGNLVSATDRHDARVRQMRGRSRLAQEALAYIGAASEMRWQRLDRDGPIEMAIPAEVDNAHSAAANLALDVVLASKGSCERGELRHGQAGNGDWGLGN